MTNFQWALIHCGLMKTLSHAKLTRNRMLITGEGYFTDEKGRCRKKVLSVIFRGVRHHNDKWEVVSGGIVTKDKLEIPFKGTKGYRY